MTITNISHQTITIIKNGSLIHLPPRKSVSGSISSFNSTQINRLEELGVINRRGIDSVQTKQWRVYYGASGNPNLEPTELALLHRQLISDSDNSFSIAEYGYKYFCFPSELGNQTTFVDPVTGFELMMADADDGYAPQSNNVYCIYKTIDGILYRIYRSKHELGVNITIRVRQ